MIPNAYERPQFSDRLRRLYYGLLQEEVARFMLKNCVEDPITVFDLTVFSHRHEIQDTGLVLDLVDELVVALGASGWKTLLCYGNTCLAIFVDRPPLFLAGQLQDGKVTL